MRKKVLILLLYMFSSSSYPEDVSRDYRETGRSLLYDLKSCKKNGEKYNCGSATGYIIGVLDILEGTHVCPPKGIQNGQIFDTVVIFMEKNNESNNRPRIDVVTDALIINWPCHIKNHYKRSHK